MLAFLLLTRLLPGASDGVAPEAPLPRGNYNSFGYYTPPPRKRAVEREPEIVAEVIAAATEPVFRKPSPPKRVTPAMLPAAKPVDEQRVLAAMQAARREWIERDDDDVIAVALALAYA